HISYHPVVIRLLLVSSILKIVFSFLNQVLFIRVFFNQAEDGIRDATVTGVQTCALPICSRKTRKSPGISPPASGLPCSSPSGPQIGRASCRERVLISVSGQNLKNICKKDRDNI